MALLQKKNNKLEKKLEAQKPPKNELQNAQRFNFKPEDKAKDKMIDDLRKKN